MPVLAQTVLPPFNANYSVRTVGPLPGGYGGVAFHHANANVLLYGSYSSGRIQAVSLQRDGQGRIVGIGTATVHATLPAGPDGGLAYGPNNVLFYTVYGANEVGQILPGGNAPARIHNLYSLGMNASVGACAFTPANHPGGRRLKLVAWSSGEWREATLAPEPGGTFDITGLSAPISIQFGPEGILYPPTGSPSWPDHQRVLVADWSNAGIDLYDTNAIGDPIPASRVRIVEPASGAGGGAIDPVTGDMVFTDGAGRLLVLSATPGCGSFRIYGQGGAGATGVPGISGSGCARLASTFTVNVTGGVPGAFGALAVGFVEWNVPVFNLYLLNEGYTSISHTLNAGGAYSLQVAVPGRSVYGNFNVYFQGGYLDPATPFGFSSTRGLHVHVD